MSEILSQISERELLNRLKIYMPKNQIDNDTAKIDPLNNKLLINADIIVEDIHFTEKTICAQDVGWKAVAANYSDLASNGVGEIIGITIGLITPPETEWKWVEGVYKGIKKALNTFGGVILGGDCSRGKERILSINAIGTEGLINLSRANAMPGDYLVTSGHHGLSKLGLALLQGKELKEKFNSNFVEKAISAHQTPIPPLQALRTLEKCKPKNFKPFAGGTDSSDGLIEAIQNLCFSSNCKAILNLEELPKDPEWPIGEKWEEWCMRGGEDFELVLSLPHEWAKNFLAIQTNSKIIGRMEAGPPIILDKKSNQIINSGCDFKHFL